MNNVIIKVVIEENEDGMTPTPQLQAKAKNEVEQMQLLVVDFLGATALNIIEKATYKPKEGSRLFVIKDRHGQEGWHDREGPPDKADLDDLAAQIPGRAFSTFRFLAYSSWDCADEEGWINFFDDDEFDDDGNMTKRGKGSQLLAAINEEDKDHFDLLETLGLLENRGSGMFPSIRLTQLGWYALAHVSATRFDGDPGWRHREQDWNASVEERRK